MSARIRTVLLLLFAFSPALFTAKLIWTKSVDVGAWDMWENAPLLEKWHNGTLGWSDLYAPQIQHRIVVPRLLILAMSHLSGGDFRWENYFCYLLIATSSLLLWRLLNRTSGMGAWRWPVMFAINLLLFCPMHYQNMLWGSSMWSTIPITCLLGIIVLLTPRAGTGGLWWRALLSILLAEIATHSFAHGMAVWPVTLGLLLLNGELGTWKQRGIVAGTVALVATVTITFYFRDFINVAWHAYGLKPGDHALTEGKPLFQDGNLRIVLNFYFAFLGTWFSRTPFVEHPLHHAIMLGQIAFGFFACVTVFALRNRVLRPILPWLALGGYVLLVALMVSKRGADIGEHRAITPRYLTVSQYLMVAGIAMTATLGVVFRRANERWRDKHPELASQNPRGLPHTLGIILLTVFCTAQIPVWQYGLHLMDVWHYARRQAQALLLFLPHVQDQGRLISLETIDMDVSNWRCLDAVNTLERIGLLRTKPLETPELRWFKKDSKPLTPSKAGVLSAKVQDDGVIELKGLARFNVGQPVDAVLIVQNGRVISLGQPTPRNLLRIYALDYEFSNAHEVQIPEMYPWLARLKAPVADAPLELWALDVAARRISRIAADITLDMGAKTATIKEL